MLSSDSKSPFFALVVVGPTAVGKTALAIRLAQYFNTEIISADSRQFYRELNIGTAKPTSEELSAAPHHFVNNLSLEDPYDVAAFEKEALKTMEALFKRNNYLVIAGGSGLFVKALCEGLDEMPPVRKETRQLLINLYEVEGIEALQIMLQEKDPDYYQSVDLQNPQRLMRALEVCLDSGQAYSSFRKGTKKRRKFETIKIGLELPRPILYQRIDSRMDAMLEKGLVEEAKNLYPYKNHNALQTVGYQEIFPFLDGQYDRDEMVRLLKRNSRRYAKRQLTWFKKDAEVQWFSPVEWDKILSYILQSKKK